MKEQGKIKNFLHNLIQEVKATSNYHRGYRGGVIVHKVCDCGKYSPRSTSGVIDNNCRNCGGKRKQIILR